jgi:hypothetical protein
MQKVCIQEMYAVYFLLQNIRKKICIPCIIFEVRQRTGRSYMTYPLWNKVKQMFLLNVTYCFLMSAAGDPYTPQHQLHIQPHPDHHQPDIQAIGNYQTCRTRNKTL